MAQVLQATGVVGHVPTGFSVVKGILLVVSLTLVGFVMTYQLISTSGDYTGLGQNLKYLRKRDDTEATLPMSSDPVSSTPATAQPSTTSLGVSPTGTSSAGQSTNSMPPSPSTTSTAGLSIWLTTGGNANTTGADSNTTGGNSTDDTWSNLNNTNMLDAINNDTTATSIVIATTTTTTAAPTTTPKPCFREGYKIRNSCDVTSLVNTSYGTSVTLEDVGHMLFKTEILDQLADTCDDGDWCVNDDWPLVSDDNDYFDFCSVGDCLRVNMPDECLDEKRRLIISTLLLLCGSVSDDYNITDQCYIGLRKMTHVSMATVMKNGDGSNTCDADDAQFNCSHNCQQLSRGLYCMCEICDHQKDMYREYSPWQWFFTSDDVIDTCHIGNDTTCNFLMSATQSWFDGLWHKLQTVDVNNVSNAHVLTGVIITGVVMVTVLAVSVWACVRKGSVFRRYTRDRIEYTQVEEDEEEEFDTA